MNTLEKMGAFFNARLDGYEEHQMTTIDFANEFYPDHAFWISDAEPVWSWTGILKLCRMPK